MSDRYRPPMPTITLERARELRGASTDVENELWYRLRAGRMDGLKFRRQHPIPPYVVDFYCDAEKLIIELDGSQHSAEADAARTRFLEARGLRVLRFSNHEVLLHKEAVLEAIWNATTHRPLSPTPLPMGEGLKS